MGFTEAFLSLNNFLFQIHTSHWLDNRDITGYYSAEFVNKHKVLFVLAFVLKKKKQKNKQIRSKTVRLP